MLTAVTLSVIGEYAISVVAILGRFFIYHEFAIVLIRQGASMDVKIDFECLLVTIKEARKILGISYEQVNDSQMAYMIVMLQDMARELLQD